MKKSELRLLIRKQIKESYLAEGRLLKEEIKAPSGWTEIKDLSNMHRSEEDGEIAVKAWDAPMEGWDEENKDIIVVRKEDDKFYLDGYIPFGSFDEQGPFDTYEEALKLAVEEMEAFKEDWDKESYVNEAAFKHISPKENKIKDAIKDVEKKFRLKANRDNPPQYAQLSLNKIMLSKVLGREELGKEHQGAWEKLKQEYNLRDAVNEGFTKDDWDVKWKLPKDNLFNASKSIDAVNNRSNAIQDLLKLNPKALQAFNNDDEHPAMKMSYNELMRWYYPIMKESVNESKMEKEFAMIAARSEKSDLLMKISNELFPKIAKGQKDGKLINFKPLSQKQRDQVYIEYTKRVGPGVGNEVNEGPGQKHYTKDGKEWTGPTHKMPGGPLMTGDPHNDDSEELFHKADLKEVADPITLEIIGALSIIVGGSFGIKFGMDLLAKIVDKALKAAKYNATEMLKIVKDNTAALKAAAQEGKKSFAKKLMSLLGITSPSKDDIPFTIKRNEGTCGYDTDARTGKKFQTPGGL